MKRTRLLLALLVNTAVIVGGAIVLSAGQAQAKASRYCLPDSACEPLYGCVVSDWQCCPNAPGNPPCFPP